MATPTATYNGRNNQLTKQRTTIPTAADRASKSNSQQITADNDSKKKLTAGTGNTNSSRNTAVPVDNGITGNQWITVAPTAM